MIEPVIRWMENNSPFSRKGLVAVAMLFAACFWAGWQIANAIKAAMGWWQ